MSVKKIPQGKVATYAGLAKTIGNPGATRAVGTALKQNTFLDIPCHRVVCSDGRVGSYNSLRGNKEVLLEKEGVDIINGRVDLDKYSMRYGKRINS